MFKHACKLAFRNLLRNKIFSFINITGLAIGMACSILILLLIDELIKVDQFHLKKDRIYAVYNRVEENGEIKAFPGTSSLLAPYLQSNIPQVENVVRVQRVGNFYF
jgi:hypothetical protein